MKQFITLLFSIFLGGFFAFGQDHPNSSSNFQSMPAGSLVVAMDNVWQLDDNANASKRYFNLKSYGLVTHLLNNGIKVKRVIAKGKGKDAVDFSVNATQVKPTGGSSSSKDFRSGPFVIFAGDLSNALALIEDFNNNVGGFSGITSPAKKVKVYRTDAPVMVDVRYDYSAGFKPKAAILDIGADPGIHEFYFESSGVGTTNYSIITETSSLVANCFTFASSPHASSVPPGDIQNVKAFVEAGGNFLAQCKATETYEEGGHFHTNNGTLTVLNEEVPITQFPNADLNYAQFHGGFKMVQGGAVKSWKYNGTLKSSTYITVTGVDRDGNQAITASASKQTGSSMVGGVVFYLGNHRYSDIEDYNEINGIRQYLNAFLTPATAPFYMKEAILYKSDGDLDLNIIGGPAGGYPVKFKVYYDNGTNLNSLDAADEFVSEVNVLAQGNMQRINITKRALPLVIQITATNGCPAIRFASSPIILPISLNTFNATRNRSMVNVVWETVSEENSLGFNLQRLLGSGIWETVAFVPSRAAGGNSNRALQYSYTDANSFKGVSQYRLQQVDNAGKQKLSDIRAVKGEAQNSSLLLYPNPSTNGQVNLIFDDQSTRDVHVFDFSGRLVKEYKNVTNNNLMITNLKSGVYSVQVKDRINGTAAVEKLMVK